MAGTMSGFPILVARFIIYVADINGLCFVLCALVCTALQMFLEADVIGWRVRCTSIFHLWHSQLFVLYFEIAMVK